MCAVLYVLDYCRTAVVVWTQARFQRKKNIMAFLDDDMQRIGKKHIYNTPIINGLLAPEMCTVL